MRGRTAIATGLTVLGIAGAGAAQAGAHHYECEWGVTAHVYAGDAQDPADVAYAPRRSFVCEPNHDVGVTLGDRPQPRETSGQRRTSDEPKPKPKPKCGKKHKKGGKAKSRKQCKGRR